KELVLTCTGKYDTPEKLDVDRKKVYEETTAKVVQVEKKEVPEEAPLLYDLTALQRSANTKLGLTAEQTLNIAQKLYEGGYISYPRTGCSYITEDIFEQVPSLIGLLKQHPRFTWHAENLCNQPLNRHCVDDSKMTDHHALIITENYPQRLSLDEQNIYSMIAGRMLEAFSGKCLKETVSVQADCNGVLFGIKGSQIKVPGWRGIYNEPSEKEEGSLLPEFQEDEILPVLGIDTLVKKTKPQPIFTEASLLAAMEGCGRTLDDEKEKEAMEDSGLGTPATRAGIIELLIARHYVERNGRSLIPTPKGLEVYDIVKEKMIANVSMTGGWECALHEIETGKVSTETFTQSINSYTQQITSELLALKLNHPDLPHCNCPKCGAETIIVFNKVAKCSDPNCGFLLFRTFNGRELTDNQMLLLLSGKRTGYLKFTSKKGKKYEASLELDDNYRIEMTFKDNKPKK
ncbi:DNA topoisomerase III, partial [Bacteroides ovatus]